MDTLEINKCFYKYREYFGTFPLDRIPQTHLRPCSMIINTDKSNQPGTHWVAILLNRDGTGEYFDSFGLPPLHSELYQAHDGLCPLGYTVNRMTLQHPLASSCGRYCVLYLKLRLRGYRKAEIYNLFSGDKLRNEGKVEKWDICKL